MEKAVVTVVSGGFGPTEDDKTAASDCILPWSSPTASRPRTIGADPGKVSSVESTDGAEEHETGVLSRACSPYTK